MTSNVQYLSSPTEFPLLPPHKGNSSPRQQELHKQKSEAQVCEFIADYIKHSHPFIQGS